VFPIETGVSVTVVMDDSPSSKVDVSPKLSYTDWKTYTAEKNPKKG
jgi:hypothetical protein